MKTHVDFEESSRLAFITSRRLKSRMRRYWGTTTTYDYTKGETVEVYSKRVRIEPPYTHTKRVKILAKTFGFWHSIKDERFKDIDKYWMFLNPNKDRVKEENIEIFTNKLNNKLTIGEKFVVTVGIESKHIPEDLTKKDTETPQEYKDRIKTYISNNLTTGYSSDIECSSEGDTLAKTAVGFYMFRQGSEEFFYKRVLDITITPIERPNPLYSRVGINGIVNVIRGQPRTIVTATISVKIEVEQKKDLYPESDFVKNMYNNNKGIVTSYVESVEELDDDPSTSSIRDDGITGLLNSRRYPQGRTDEKWCNGLLRTEVSDSYTYGRDDYSALIARCLDTDYKVKEKGGFFSGFFGKILAIVIIVVAVWFTGPAALAALKAGSVVAFAVAMGTMALILTIGQIVLVLGGADKGVLNMFGKFVQVVSLISAIASVAAFLKSALKSSIQNLTWESIKGKVMSYFSTEISVRARDAILENAVKVAGEAALDSATHQAANNALQLSWKKISSSALKLITEILSKLNAKKLEDADSKVSDLNEEYLRSQAELQNINDREMHVGIEHIKWYSKPLKEDNIQFEVDYLYEGTRHNILRPSFISPGLNVRDRDYELRKKISLDID